ncbi:unnamed protein product [Anisakis simplex]|uniref:MARVEL domain-containing protein n=1 Tax=Anisakis simplex TaxID=6269 RepID=A0A0M3KBU6_ANISI|nr:unnamed protein product [Anisakis simplex]
MVDVIDESSSNDRDEVKCVQLKHCCCTVDYNYCQEKSDFDFERKRFRHRACFGRIHVQKLSSYLIVIKSMLIIILLITAIAQNSETFLISVCSVGLFLMVATYTMFMMGVWYQRLNYLVPYWCVAHLIILVLVVQVFIDLLMIAATRHTADNYQTFCICAKIFWIAFELYTVRIVWDVYEYVCDLLAEEEFKESTRLNDTTDDDTDHNNYHRSKSATQLPTNHSSNSVLANESDTLRRSYSLSYMYKHTFI